MKETYLWEENIEIKKFPSINKDVKTDVLIIGGGITGILCAYELKKRNIDYILVEQDRIANATTKKTTAFITAQHETLYQDLIKNEGKDVAQQYLDINLKAVKRYKELADLYSFDFKECDSTIYSVKSNEIILKEKEALDSLNCNTKLIDKLPINLPIKLGISFSNQATLHPLKLIKEISKDLNIYELSKVDKLKKDTAYINNHTITFKNVIIATHYPFINLSGFYFTKLTQRRSYVVCLKHQEIQGTYCNIDEDGMYFRSQRDYLILGGNDRDNKDKARINFKDKIKDLYNQNIEYSWSCQDCITLDGMPYIGRYDRFHNNYYVATGFNLWGFTWAMASSFILADLIENKNTYSFISPQRHMNKKELLSNLKISLKNIVTLKTPRCKHLGCALMYNELEQTWECPCHGSRYDINGKVLDGPSKKNLKL